ncbi:ImmA/IrrE family metallo-endopeptidase [Corynebacterium pseudokroppenstedtii]|uniref:ImmA/IrrE family metallo-endopeptidase n=2 Tax=Corynebacterium pseudokroppenstedtii TaxID=2804917 RepID=A0AAU0Q0P5_9CORY|nr:ImmA/IrrE family metallo-endopeptidase [Corynebacterium pseudokroppenstedtii]MCF8703957.1 ImmA/IrrE family metallo-endopeptidase [Corynebacterium pseudokroppenstedtii]
MMTIQTAPNLEVLAATHGITITTHTGGEKGRWYSNTRTISIRRDLGWVNSRCTLAHELGHAFCGHDSRAEGWFKERQEHEADTWAANLLIGQDEYMDAELIHGSCPGAIALELGVTVHLVTVWEANHNSERHVTS